jgi:ribose 5-phosphate isomerase A
MISLNEAGTLDLTVDGADEIGPGLSLIKGGGAALTCEKIVAAQADKFICIADASKNVAVLGAFALPVEVIPMAAPEITRRFKAMGAVAVLRSVNGQTLVTDNGQYLLDVKGLQIADAWSFENTVSQWPGVVTVGVFAHQHAHVCLLGTAQGVQTIVY